MFKYFNNLEILNTFSWLLWRDIRTLSKGFINSVLDATILPMGIVLLFGKVLPLMGMPINYGAILLIGTLNGMFMWTASAQSANFVTDLSGDKSINSELVLPIYSWLLYIKYALSYAIRSFFMSILIVPLGIIFLKSIDLTQVSLLKFIFAYISAAIFFGFFTLFVAIYVKDILNFGRFWMRWGWLLFNMGGSQFSWLFMYKTMPTFAILNLLNPLIYPIEALRASFLGQCGYFPYAFSISAIWFFIVIFAIFGIKKFKIKLDCI